MSNAEKWLNGKWDFHLDGENSADWKVTLDGETIKGVKAFKVSAEVGSIPSISLTIIPSRCNLFVTGEKSVGVGCKTVDVTVMGDEHKGRAAM